MLIDLETAAARIRSKRARRAASKARTLSRRSARYAKAAARLFPAAF